MSNILDYLVEENEFPIIFIGSGISKRYLNNYPSWIELLEYLWGKSNLEWNFYGHLTKIRDELSQGRDLPEYILDYEVNVRVAAELEKSINGLFSDDELAIDGITHKEVYEKKLSPFKALISNKFNDYTILDTMKEEFELFKSMISKAQILLTTNYDSFIEDSYNNISNIPVKTYIGQRGFFEQTTGFAELYKIHGCASDSSSIVITERDYIKFDKDSVLISAKIISMLLNSPIIFIGYSLKDRNIRTIIKDFTASLSSDELLRLEKRLIVIEWEAGEENIIEGLENDPELGCRFTTIRTNNYSEIYKKISQINQGVSPAEIRRYQHVIKRLIVERGKEGSLETVLLSPSQIDDTEGILKQKNWL
ncbi:SIR2 family protein [Clostridium butanoliproducens]|uniref:SIR2 family protein n=1 Tax=Clostridium butanoliproducens TaxID=2991837 RepID=UPI0024BA4270|nr:SIR2 family protein [Clostridium butanoliproducens]